MGKVKLDRESSRKFCEVRSRLEEIENYLKSLSELSSVRMGFVIAEVEKRYEYCDSKGHKAVVNDYCGHCYRRVNPEELGTLEQVDATFELTSKRGEKLVLKIPPLESSISNLSNTASTVFDMARARFEIAREFGYIK